MADVTDELPTVQESLIEYLRVLRDLERRGPGGVLSRTEVADEVARILRDSRTSRFFPDGKQHMLNTIALCGAKAHLPTDARVEACEECVRFATQPAPRRGLLRRLFGGR